MFFFMPFVALLIDRIVPYPKWLTKTLGHPVIWQGLLISKLETRFNRTEYSPTKRGWAGLLTLVILIAVSAILSLLLVALVRPLPFSFVVEALFASSLLAHRELAHSVRHVASSLDISLANGRQAVSHIVGRDISELDQHDVSRAAIESLAENSSDGVIAPLFWLVIFGLPGIVIYKAINTADSMIGHKNQQYLDFGRASAKLDDLVNWLPARLTAMLYALAANFDKDKNVAQSWKIATRDAPNHISPNAGWPEAALAGALDFSLGGPRTYHGQSRNLPKMGSGKRDLMPDDIRRALKLFSTMSLIALGLVGLLALISF